MGLDIQLDPGERKKSHATVQGKGTRCNIVHRLLKVLSNNISLACWFRSLEDKPLASLKGDDYQVCIVHTCNITPCALALSYHPPG